MLEPAVRPVSPPSAVAPVGRVPFEQQGFESLLESFSDPQFNPLPGQDDESTDDSKPDADPAAATSLLAPLADISRIENPALRALLAQRLTPDA